MNIKELHDSDKPVSAKSIFQGEVGSVTAIQLLADQELKAHITKTPAFLICLSGKVIFNNEQGQIETLFPGDYIEIEPMVKHWLNTGEDSHLLLCK